VSRLEPVIRACEATEDVRGWFLLVQALPVWWATPYEESQHPRTEAKAAGRARSPAGREAVLATRVNPPIVHKRIARCVGQLGQR